MNPVAISVRTITLLFVIIVFLAAGCKSRKNTSNYPDLKEIMPGTWEILSVKTTCPTHRGSDTTRHVEIPQGKWREIMKIAPILLTYKRNGSFFSEYRTVNDSLFFIAEGTWDAKNDSIYITQGKKNITYAYQVQLNGNTARIIGKIDWDEDGEKDDIYDKIQKKVE